MPRRVLITRGAERSTELLKLLQQAGITVIAEPVTLTTRIADAASLPDLSRVDWIAFTSANAVTAFVEILAESRHQLPPDVRLAAVGPATAQMVRQQLRSPEIVCGAATGADLAHALLKGHDDNSDVTVLWPCAQDAMPDFAHELSAAGANTIEWPVYATEGVPPWILHARLERPSSFDVVVFAAPSAVKSLAEAWPQPWTFAAVAIGPTTAAALRKASAAEVFVSNSPRSADIFSSIQDALNREQRLDAELPVTHLPTLRR